MAKRNLAALAFLAAGWAAAARAEEIKADLKEGKFTGGKAELIGYDEGQARVFMYCGGKAEFKVTVPEDGEYTLKLEMSCDAAKNVNAEVKLSVGAEVVKDKFVLTQPEPKEYEFKTTLKKGEHTIVVEYTNDEYKEGEFDRNFFLHAMKMEKK